MTTPVLSIWRGEIGGPPKRETMAEIAARVANDHGLTVADLKGASQARGVSWARQHAYAEMYATGRLSTTQIGRFFGRDHTTVVYGIRKHRERCG